MSQFDDPKRSAILGRFQERMPAPKQTAVAQPATKAKKPKREPAEKMVAPKLSDLKPIHPDETIDPEELGRDD